MHMLCLLANCIVQAVSRAIASSVKISRYPKFVSPRLCDYSREHCHS
jgi:uncharacterized Rmd1/YagE family protein